MGWGLGNQVPCYHVSNKIMKWKVYPVCTWAWGFPLLRNVRKWTLRYCVIKFLSGTETPTTDFKGFNRVQLLDALLWTQEKMLPMLSLKSTMGEKPMISSNRISRARGWPLMSATSCPKWLVSQEREEVVQRWMRRSSYQFLHRTKICSGKNGDHKRITGAAQVSYTVAKIVEFSRTGLEHYVHFIDA